ncbi:MAG: outer membrane protein transport protein [Candidatus Sedimenticola sp. PURPLELP]
MNFKRQLLAVAISSLTVSSAWATNGYAPHGIGQISKGMGGVGVALPQDSLAGGINPAGMAFVGNRMDLGAEVFRPIRGTVVGGTDRDASAKKHFLVPEFGYNRMLNDKMSVGVSVFGNGGMNTNYKMGLFGSTNSGIDLAQLFIVPTVAYKINENNAIGVGLNLAYQQFTATGLQGFGVMDPGTDSSTGAGLRIGWTGKVSDSVTLGATYQSKTKMGEFDKYNNLFAEQGDFDIPSNFALGVAFQATPQLTVGFDVMRINYGGVRAISNVQNEGGALGADNGSGFGWDDQTIYKLGLSYDYSKSLTLRAGFNHGSIPYASSQTQFNTLAPATVEDHLTFGATWKLDNGMSVTGSYMHAFENTITGVTNAQGSGAGFNNRMYQDSLGVAVSWDM